MFAVCLRKSTKRTAFCVATVIVVALLALVGRQRSKIVEYDRRLVNPPRRAQQSTGKTQVPVRDFQPTTRCTHQNITTTPRPQHKMVTDRVALASKLQPKCSAQRKVVFVKTHKTASSSVQRMIVQHLKRTKSVRPARFPPIYIGGYPGRFNLKFVFGKYGKPMDATGQRPEAIADHIRFDKASLAAFMPAGTSYITILRNPSDALFSSFNYYYGLATSIGNFDRMGVTCVYSPFLDLLGRPNASFAEYLKIAPTRLNPQIPWYFRSLNYQAHDLGLDPTRTDAEYVREQIRILDSTFHLVMIADYFMESLVLLREELCMDWSILTSEIVNKGSYDKYQLNAREKSAVRQLTRLDQALYYHFNRTLWRKVDAYGRERMARDIGRIKKPPNSQQDAILRHLSNDEDGQSEERDFAIEDISSRYKADAYRRLVERIPRGTKMRVADDVVKEMASYMIENAGGCNL